MWRTKAWFFQDFPNLSRLPRKRLFARAAWEFYLAARLNAPTVCEVCATLVARK